MGINFFLLCDMAKNKEVPAANPAGEGYTSEVQARMPIPRLLRRKSFQKSATSMGPNKYAYKKEDLVKIPLTNGMNPI
jgi:hypothetical protein